MAPFFYSKNNNIHVINFIYYRYIKYLGIPNLFVIRIRDKGVDVLERDKI